MALCSHLLMAFSQDRDAMLEVTLDRAWLALKRLCQHVPRKTGRGADAKPSELFKLLVQQFMWRESLGAVTAAQFLRLLGAEFAALKD